jgi:hypothetical protein
MHEAMRPIIIGILHREIDEKAQEKIRDAAIDSPAVID